MGEFSNSPYFFSRDDDNKDASVRGFLQDRDFGPCAVCVSGMPRHEPTEKNTSCPQAHRSDLERHVVDTDPVCARREDTQNGVPALSRRRHLAWTSSQSGNGN